MGLGFGSRGAAGSGSNSGLESGARKRRGGVPSKLGVGARELTVRGSGSSARGGESGKVAHELSQNADATDSLKMRIGMQAFLITGTVNIRARIENASARLYRDRPTW